MADTGWVIAGAGADAGGGDDGPWSLPGRVTADDGSETSVNIGSSGDWSSYLRASTFGLSVPAGATIDGIETRIQARQNSGGADYLEVKLMYNGVQQGVKLPGVAIAGSATNYDYGGASDLWGGTWAAGSGNDVNNNLFAFQIQVEATGTTINTYVDAMWVKVYYTEAASGGNLIWPIT